MALTEAFQQFTRDMIDLERAWTCARDLSGLRALLGDARHHLCHAFVVLEGYEPVHDGLPEGAQILAHEAYLSVIAIGQLLEHARDDLLATPFGISSGKRGVGVMLDQLAPYVSRADVTLRRSLLDGASIDDALASVRDTG
jgi:hypothetical protein